MKQFMGLREFCLLQDPTEVEYMKNVYKERYDPYETSVFRSNTICPIDVVVRYDLARELWEKFGDEGPPIGSKVEMMEPGHGGPIGITRIFRGVYDGDDRFFAVSRPENDKEYISLVSRKTWFVHMRPYDDQDDCIGTFRKRRMQLLKEIDHET